MVWYSQIMALFSCSVGDYAVIRYCDVITYGDDSEDAGYLNRPRMKFELEKSRGRMVLKYDVVEIDTIAPTLEGSMKRPPYMAPAHGAGMVSHHGLAVTMVDSQFF